MKLALIGPTAYLERFCSQSNIHLVLAHKVLEDEEYRNFYRKMRDRGDYIIMDNSAFELGSAIPMDNLLKATNLVNAQEMVLPDVYLNAKATTRRVNEAIASLYGRSLIGKYKLHAVPQGDDIKSYLKCFDEISSTKEVKVIGLSFGAIYESCKSDYGSLSSIQRFEYRMHFIKEQLKEKIKKDKEYHALGILDNPVEMKLLEKLGFIRSNDTSSPIWHGIHDIKFDAVNGHSPKLKSKVNFDKRFEEDKVETIQHNINICKQWCNDAP